MVEHLVTTAAKQATCPGCGTALLVGLDGGLPVRVNAQSIDKATEIRFLIAGLWTYVQTSDRRLMHRTAERIRSNYLKGPIHVQHQCVAPTLI